MKADRNARHEADMKRRRVNESLEYKPSPPLSKKQHKPPADNAENPSTEASDESASIKHAQENHEQKTEGKRYEASQPYRARKGDRLS